MSRHLPSSLHFAVLALFCSPASADPIAYQIARIEAPQFANHQRPDPLTVRQILELFNVPGISTAVSHNFKILWTKSYGVADVETSAPISDKAVTIDRAASFAPSPTPEEFTALRIATGETCPPIRNLVCAPVGDAPVFECKWEEQFEGKPWIGGSALVARKGAQWLWLDGGPRCFAIPQN